ncbi:diguanylate cyclase [Neptuniibacter sp. 1_MG-2023]|uniref:GGDEF domain-containing protein n=1 Tax=Neptuniibacter sp. 1_MG-2023 TaxID=3062662 RepID=UPI0026E190D1|nr:diguanylate cyclase [Neptuniibacter sp. 1_MG-2023]MDO6593568.1 diguanylate cyclase [Neptuniibacter sp. 1_MG-2023]
MIKPKSGELPDILIVDDDNTVIMALNKALGEIGRIRFALDARQALTMIKAQPPKLLLLDMGLPDINGLEVCRTLKDNPDTADIPVLFITSNSELGFEEAVFDAGAADYIVKPLNPRVVAARVQTHLNYHQAIHLLEQLAKIDSMTGLANRRAFDERLSVELRRMYREREPLTVAMIDIDQFKKYNDHFGHIEGDVCIKGIAQALANNVRRPADMVARYGGEEFALILPNTNKEGAEILLQKLILLIEELNVEHAPDAIYKCVTVSVGYSTFYPEKKNQNHLDDWAVVKAADRALYASKDKGRNRLSYQSVE